MAGSREGVQNTDWRGDVDLSVLSYIPRDIDYSSWRNVGMAIKAAGLDISVWQQWCGGERKKSTGEWITEDLTRYWGVFPVSRHHMGKCCSYSESERVRATETRLTGRYRFPTGDLIP